MMPGKKLVPLLLLLLTGAAACAPAGGTSAAGAGRDRPSNSRRSKVSAQRAIAEADIIQLDGGRLYALSRSGTVSVVDLSTPSELSLLGQTRAPGEPFEMYRRGEVLVVMSNGAVGTDGVVQDDGAKVAIDAGGGAAVTVIDMHDPSLPQTVATLGVPGEIADSRVIGNVLYIATYENALCYGCGGAARTMVTSLDIAFPTSIRQIEQVTFPGAAPTGTDLWGYGWRRSIIATDQRLYVAGHAGTPVDYGSTAPQGVIDVLDITDPRGRFGIGARIMVTGPVLSRWQMDERDGVLRVVSQKGVAETPAGIGAPVIETFLIESTKVFTPLGRTSMRLPRQEGLRAVRFDGARAYAITFARTDPLFIIDLSDPKNPRQRGELVIPGFMFHLEPQGSRVIGLGIDGSDPSGSLNVSLFDVADPDRPRMLSRASFATPHVWSDADIIEGEIPEDQDRIQKAFRVLPSGLVVVPFNALRSYYSSYNYQESCGNSGGGVQLVEWSNDTLQKRALLPVPGNPRRAFEHNEEMIAVSDSNVRAFSVANLAVAHQTADVVIGTCVPEATPYYGVGVGGQGDWEGRGQPLHCSAAPGGAGATLTSCLALAALALAAGARRRRAVRSRLG
jgi:hypothetical protein